MSKLYVLDASGYLYRSYHAIKQMTNLRGESTNALFGFVRSILKLIKDFNPDHLVAVFDGPQGIKSRKEIYQEYKSHRVETPKDLPYQIEWAQKFCELCGIPSLIVPEVEADDTMASIAKWGESNGFIVYLCSSDKDLAQLVSDNVFILNTHKDNLVLDADKVEEIYGVPPNLIMDWLSLTGDSSDNIPGVKGVGPKTASELLKQFGSLDNLLENINSLTGKRKETFLAEGDMARLSRKLVALDTKVEFPRKADFFLIKPQQIGQLKDFYSEMSFSSLLKGLTELPVEITTPSKKERLTVTIVNNEETLDLFLNNIKCQKEVGFYIEVSDLHPMKAEMEGIGFALKADGLWYVPLNNHLSRQSVIKVIKPLFEEGKIAFYGHNTKFHKHVLLNSGIKVNNICFDTMVASYILSSNVRDRSLEYLTLHYFGEVKVNSTELIGKGKKAIAMRDVPLEQLAHFCGECAHYILRLKEKMVQELEERNLRKLYDEIEHPLTPVLTQMERHGIYIDLDQLQAMAILTQQQLSKLAKEIFDIAGGEFNLNSPKQMSDILFNKLQIKAPSGRGKKTDSGHSTGAEVLEELKEAYPIAGKILEYRTLEKLRSGYLEALPLEVLASTHRIHCNFNQTIAATGRLSCQDPNLQNIPTRTEVGRAIREAFIPEKKGWSYLAADYSQIELRLLAHLSEDPSLIQAFQQNEDIHSYTASLVFNVPIKEVTKDQRYQAKTVNFGVVYGQGEFGLSKELGISRLAAADFIQKYFQRYSKVKDYIESSKQKARQTGKAITLTGRERAIPEINSKNGMIRAEAERLAVNTPLQGTAADLIKKAMIALDKRLNKEQKLSKMILQIHDELLFEVPDFELIDLEALVKKEMEGVFKLKVPLVVDIAIGKNWKEC